MNLIVDKYDIEAFASRLRSLDYLAVKTDIRGTDLTVGYLCLAEALDLKRIYAAKHDLVFVRWIENYNDIFSYVEKTLSLSINVYWLLSFLNVRLIATYFRDTTELNLSCVENYSTESDLGIGFLRRCNVTSTCFEYRSVPKFLPALKIADVYAEQRSSILERRTIAKAPAYDPNQDSLF